MGSVGTRCWIFLFTARDGTEPLLLQVKEAQPSVLAAFAGPSKYDNQGQRVVEGQWLIQPVSDIFLGWQRSGPARDGKTHDFYVRQLRDWKFSLDIDRMRPSGMEIYGELCAWTLARSHARSGDSVAIAAYLGGSDVFDQAIAQFASTLRGPDRARSPGAGHRRRDRPGHRAARPVTAGRGAPDLAASGQFAIFAGPISGLYRSCAISPASSYDGITDIHYVPASALRPFLA